MKLLAEIGRIVTLPAFLAFPCSTALALWERNNNNSNKEIAKRKIWITKLRKRRSQWNIVRGGNVTGFLIWQPERGRRRKERSEGPFRGIIICGVDWIMQQRRNRVSADWIIFLYYWNAADTFTWSFLLLLYAVLLTHKDGNSIRKKKRESMAFNWYRARFSNSGIVCLYSCCHLFLVATVEYYGDVFFLAAYYCLIPCHRHGIGCVWRS